MSCSRRSAAGFSLGCLLFFALGVAGCTTSEPREDVQLKQATADELTALLRQRELAIETMKGLFSAKVRGGIIPIATRVEGTVFYRRPNAMRLRGFTAIGSELFEFVQADDQFTLRLPTMGRVLSGHPGDLSEMGKLARPFQLSVWAMARANDPDSAGSQFFICVADAHFLDWQYTAFGEVVSGMEVADAVVNMELGVALALLNAHIRRIGDLRHLLPDAFGHRPDELEAGSFDLDVDRCPQSEIQDVADDPTGLKTDFDAGKGLADLLS